MTEEVASKDAAEKTKALLAGLWGRNLPTIERRLAILERAAGANPLAEELRADAHGVAHKLAGSLGMFGFPNGTAIARELELTLETTVPDAAVLAGLTKQLREILFPAP
jgi:HPt (histidine-containing phosphotransfer) domain-containing protein